MINMDDSITFTEEERREIAKLISEGKDEEAEALIAKILERLLERFKNQAILKDSKTVKQQDSKPEEA